MCIRSFNSSPLEEKESKRRKREEVWRVRVSHQHQARGCVRQLFKPVFFGCHLLLLLSDIYEIRREQHPEAIGTLVFSQFIFFCSFLTSRRRWFKKSRCNYPRLLFSLLRVCISRAVALGQLLLFHESRKRFIMNVIIASLSLSLMAFSLRRGEKSKKKKKLKNPIRMGLHPPYNLGLFQQTAEEREKIVARSIRLGILFSLCHFLSFLLFH